MREIDDVHVIKGEQSAAAVHYQQKPLTLVTLAEEKGAHKVHPCSSDPPGCPSSPLSYVMTLGKIFYLTLGM